MANIENKPIGLVTGAPGSGKTALLVDFIDKAVKEGRPVFQQGIPELQVNHYPLPPVEEWTERRPDPDNPDMMLPYFTFPPKSLIVLSEAQRIFRPRAAGSKVPDYVAAFETVRHTGVTFLLDTQHPDFIDTHIRKLVGQHIHLIDFGLLGRKHYEWPYCGKPDEFKSAPVKKPYKLPKHVFSLYKSASLHIKRTYTIPPVMILLALCVLLMIGGSIYVYQSIQKKVTPAKPASVAATGTGPASGSLAGKGASMDPADMLQSFVPRLRDKPESAPAYDALRVVKAMPVVAGCIQFASRCTCQTQQGTDAGLDDNQCKDWLRHPPFNPYQDPIVSADNKSQAPKTLPKANAPVVPATETGSDAHGTFTQNNVT